MSLKNKIKSKNKNKKAKNETKKKKQQNKTVKTTKTIKKTKNFGVSNRSAPVVVVFNGLYVDCMVLGVRGNFVANRT
jgi:hypothetical protein